MGLSEQEGRGGRGSDSDCEADAGDPPALALALSDGDSRAGRGAALDDATGIHRHAPGGPLEDLAKEPARVLGRDVGERAAGGQLLVVLVDLELALVGRNRGEEPRRTGGNLSDDALRLGDLGRDGLVGRDEAVALDDLDFDGGRLGRDVRLGVLLERLVDRGACEGLGRRGRRGGGRDARALAPGRLGRDGRL